MDERLQEAIVAAVQAAAAQEAKEVELTINGETFTIQIG